MHAHPTWIFDLDNTLHNASLCAFPVINQSMNDYLVTYLGITEEEASSLRTHYWRRYGATLTGLMQHHPQIDPHHFLLAAHPLDQVTAHIHPMPGLRRTLQQLKGRKILFTNSPSFYAEALLQELAITEFFDAIFAVETARLQPKPCMAGYRLLLQKYSLDPHHCIMVEDTRHNLLPAKRLGMRTVWLRSGTRRALEADITLQHLHQLTDYF